MKQLMSKLKTSKKTMLAFFIPLLVIILFLVKIVHTLNSSRNDPFVSRGGMVFTEEQFMQDFEASFPIEKAIYAVVIARKKTGILEKIQERRELNKENKKYQWLGLGVKDERSKFWIVTFRENFVTPKLICETKIEIDSGEASELKCELSEKDPYR